MTSLLRAELPFFFPVRKEVWLPNRVVKEVLTMQFLGRSSLRVRKLPQWSKQQPASKVHGGGGSGWD